MDRQYLTGEPDCDRNCADRGRAIDHGRRLVTEPRLAARREHDVEQRIEASGTDAQAEEVLGAATAAPQVDPSLFGAVRQVGDVGRRRESFRPLGVTHRSGVLLSVGEHRSEVSDFAASRATPTAALVEHRRQQHDRRQQRQRQELDAVHEAEQHETGEQWADDRQQLQAPRLVALGDRADRERPTIGDPRLTIRRATKKRPCHPTRIAVDTRFGEGPLDDEPGTADEITAPESMVAVSWMCTPLTSTGLIAVSTIRLSAMSSWA